MSLVRLFLPFLFLLLKASVDNSNAQGVDCLASNREALIDFKNGLEDPFNRLSSWRNWNTNCCQWHGIHCDNITGAVVAIDLGNPHPHPVFGESPPGRYGFWNLSGEIRPSLMKLKSLRHLDLSLNTFGGIPIPAFFGSLVNLQYLNLSNAGFGGIVPPNLGNLSHLLSLDLQHLSLHVENLQWVAGLNSLKHLAMNGVDLSPVGIDWVSGLNQLQSLIELHLHSCKLSGFIPSLNFTSLAVLDLGYNSFVSKIPDWLVNISSIQHIDISYSNMNGSIPIGLGDLPNLLSLNLKGNQDLTANCSQLFRGKWEKIQRLDFAINKMNGKISSSIENMTSLIYLDLSFNAIEGVIPGSIGKLCNLNTIDLSANMMAGSLPEFLQGTDSCPFRKPFPNLEYFLMALNQLTGKIPDWLVQLENLVLVRLVDNQLQGPIPSSIGSLQKLTYLGLDRNKLNGTLPDSLGQLSELSHLYVSFNQFTGMITEAHFIKTSKLKSLDLSFNSFKVNVSSNWVPPFQLRSLKMSSCALGPLFPAWLKSQKDVAFLHLSNASISGPIPNWFWDISSHLRELIMHHNHLQGPLPNPISAAFASVLEVDLSYNLLEGPIPVTNTVLGIGWLDLSHNRFSDAIPFSLGEMPSLIFIDLSSNNLTGKIPPTLENCSSLSFLCLSDNQLVGEIPLFTRDMLSQSHCSLK